jgi:two-component system CitB family sensor kinase
MDGAQSLTDGLRSQAHEFANTMHVISGLIELGLFEEARDFIAAYSPGGRMGDGATRPFLGEFELSALLAVKTAQARELGITVRVEDDAAVTPHLPDGVGHDLVTIVGNLVDNAIEACALGDSVRITGSAHDDTVTIVVEDDGPGIPDALREDVFVEGVSTKVTGGADRAHRRGIGLALVRRIVRRRRGSVRADTSELGGARFTVTLPLETAAPDAHREVTHA